jgi:hypothetical protein
LTLCTATPAGALNLPLRASRDIGPFASCVEARVAEATLGGSGAAVVLVPPAIV